MTGDARTALTQLRAWVVTGPLGRGAAFAIDFAVALRAMLVQRLGSRAQ
jgi:hypothetical protein